LKGAEVVAEIASLPIDEITIHETGVTTEEIIAGPYYGGAIEPR
jgi:hypothetical protein